MEKLLGGKLLHGADYYPEQWLHMPKILEEDIRLMKKARINTVTLGVFAWAALEPEENIWNFGWLDEITERLYRNGISFFLATPSGARPAWLAKKYPEVLRVTEDRRRNLYGMRMNHCYTSKVYRRLTKRIDRKLAERYGSHPGLLGWHISNEYHGECHCPLCQSEFRNFLQEKYGTLQALNQAWWTGFWAKTYTEWEQIESPSTIGETAIGGLSLDWKRFVTKQTREFMETEIAAVKAYAPKKPVTTNMIGSFPEIDYPRLAESIDIAALDVYPAWGEKKLYETAADAGMEYDITRGLKKAPFLLMETTPSRTNWAENGKLKPPGVHRLGCLQAVAHGADSVQYFQWRQSRGAYEKFHGAVVGHDGRMDTRVFQEIAGLGEILEALDEVCGTANRKQTAILYDWNNRWALDGAKGPRRDKGFEETVKEHYRALRRFGVNVDFIDEEQEVNGYAVIAAPILYLIKPGLIERLEDFVRRGGSLILTYFSGITDENDLCFLGGFPGPLRRLAGIRAEETDTLYPWEEYNIGWKQGNMLGQAGEGKIRWFSELIHLETAEEAAVYLEGAYAGHPALTRNRFGSGEVWYLAARAEEAFLRQWYQSILKRRELLPPGEILPEGIELSVRESAENEYWFFSNFSEQERKLEIKPGYELIQKKAVGPQLYVKPLETAVVRIKKTLDE